jgi:hypothetical protein
MMPMNISLDRIRVCRPPVTDMLVIASLIGLDVVARLAPHAPNFTPVAASALFAASVLRARGLSLLVPIFGMLLGDAVLGFDDWRMMTIVYGALALPACGACLSSRLRRPSMTMPVLLSSSLMFFLVTNFAVWAFTPMYAPNFGGLVQCYAAALPFLRYTVAGDLFWGSALFGAFWLLQTIQASNPSAVAARARL